MALAIGFFIPVFSAFMKTGLVEKFPTLIVCGFVAMAAIQSFFSGMILSTVRQKERREFEMRLVEAENRKK
jgi:hypothetical protein